MDGYNETVFSGYIGVGSFTYDITVFVTAVKDCDHKIRPANTSVWRVEVA